jgi:hypothetical protein
MAAPSLRAAPLALLLAITLASCSTPPPAPSASPEPVTPSPVIEPPSPTPSTPTAQIDELVLLPTTVELRRGGAVIGTLDYMSPAADAVATLTTAFGYPPVDEPYDGTNHRPPGVFHVWGPVTLDERSYEESRRAETSIYDLRWPRFAVYLDAPSAGDIVLRTAGDHRQGEPWTMVTDDPDSGIWACEGTPIEALETVTAGGSALATVVARENESGDAVLWLGAPALEAEGCA